MNSTIETSPHIENTGTGSRNPEILGLIAKISEAQPGMQHVESVEPTSKSSDHFTSYPNHVQTVPMPETPIDVYDFQARLADSLDHLRDGDFGYAA